jgi:hypothetical protein
VLVACAVEPAPPAPSRCGDGDDGAQTRAYRIDRVRLPAGGDGLDLDGDGRPDNRAAHVLDAVFTAYAEDAAAQAWQAQLDARLAAATRWRLALTTCPGDGAARAVLGDDPGAAAATGRIRGRAVEVGGGAGTAPVGALADVAGAADDGWHAIEAVALRVEVSDRGLGGLVAGALAPGYPEAIAAAFLPFLNELHAAGDTLWGAAIDVDRDGTITYEELLAAELFQLLLRPDLDLDGDGIPESLSFGFELQARPDVADFASR